jgi:hypothetical protein
MKEREYMDENNVYVSFYINSWKGTSFFKRWIMVIPYHYIAQNCVQFSTIWLQFGFNVHIKKQTRISVPWKHQTPKFYQVHIAKNMEIWFNHN